MNREEKLEKIVAYLRSGEKDPADFRLGFEVEHFVVDKDTLESISYYGENGVGESLKDLKNLGYEALDDSGLALRGHGVDISIEPAGQFELAISAKASVEDLYRLYEENMRKIVPVFEKRGQLLVTLGYHPKTKIDDIKVIPKARYDFMYKYFADFFFDSATGLGHCQQFLFCH